VTTACEYDRPDVYNVFIDPTFTESQRSGIIQGMNAWDNATHGNVRFRFAIGEHCSPNSAVHPCDLSHGTIVVRAASWQEMERVARHAGALGYTSHQQQDSAETLIDVTFNWAAYPDPEGLFRTTATHEAGHALGLLHTAPTSVMCAKASCVSKSITCTDLDEFSLARGIDVRCGK
jgi:hypothetical protein